jgi:spermidine/putrescine transport system substrate-binding protein
MKRKILTLVMVAGLLVLAVLPGCQPTVTTTRGGTTADQTTTDQTKTGKTNLVIYNWGEYIANESDTYTLYGKEYKIEDVIARFEAEYPQYNVNYLTYDDNEKMYPKLETESFDVIVPSDYMVVKLIKEDRLQKLDESKLPNVVKYIDNRLAALQFDSDITISDKVASYAVPYMYCTVGLIYNQDQLPKITSKNPRDVWSVLFDPAMQGRIGMYSSMRESIGVALNYLGYSLNSMNPAELDAAKALLINQRKTVKALLGIDELKDKFVSGELAAGVAWSGDYVVCQQRLEEGGEDPQILQYVVPTGSNISVDMMCIPKNAKNPAGAMDFINFMYDPEIALMNAVYVGYSSPHTEVLKNLPVEITGNTSFYPDAETMKSLEVYYSSDEIDSTYDKLWQAVIAN